MIKGEASSVTSKFHQEKNHHQSRCNKAREENEKGWGGEKGGGDLLLGLPGEGTCAGWPRKHLAMGGSWPGALKSSFAM